MAGESKTSKFLLSAATVMIGPQSDLYSLNVANHSIGLVKNFEVTAEPNYLDLTQGTQNNIVYSVMNENTVKASMEVYEFTSKNLAYGLGLDGSALSTISDTYATTGVLTADTTTAVTINAVDGIGDPLDVSGDFSEGDWVMIQDGTTDKVHITTISDTVSSFSTPTTTVNLSLAPPVNFPIGSRLSKVNAVNIGSKENQPYLSAKVVGVLPDGGDPIVLLFPKLRITRGFSLSFQTDNYGNLPFEFTPFELASTDSFYADFDGPAKLLTRS